ncbi:MAG: adaptor protein MecA [Lachnospiraceae bacterium]|nr:adaptor protein MecA [Lachnospiraceae bacterium]
MKIEKIDENSIALILKDEELKNRNLKMSDLSYGSEKAQDLLVEVMNLAKTEVGFTPDAPLAVEAVPLKDGDIKLIVTKVFNPDELDARYSRFTPMKNEKVPFSIMQMLESTIDKFEEALKQGNTRGIDEVNNVEKLEITKGTDQIAIFEFDEIDKASDACRNVNSYDYVSVFYKDEKNKKFYLVLSISGNVPKLTMDDFNKVCNTLAEYGTRIRGKVGMNQAYYEEHYKIIIKEDAVNKLSRL